MKKTVLALIVVVIVIGAAAGYVVLSRQPQQPTKSAGDDYGLGNYLDNLDSYLSDFDENGLGDFSDAGGLGEL